MTKRFLLTSFVGLTGTFFAVAAILLVVDPLGATSGNRLCRAGAKAHADGTAKSLVAHDRRPRTLVIGTSRVKRGFGPDALSRLGAGPAVNLGLEGGQADNFSEGVDEALAAGRLERVYLGVDFNLVHQRGGPAASATIAASRFPQLERLRRAFLSNEALRSAASALFDCRPRFHPDGSPTPEGMRTRALRTDADQRDRLRRELREGRGRPAEESTARLAELRALIARLRQREVEVVIFSAPYRAEVVETFAEAGLADDFARFPAELSRLADEEGAAFIDLHGAAGLRMLDLRPCPGGGIACHFLDLVHYSPEVGARIAGVIASEHTSARGPTRRP